MDHQKFRKNGLWIGSTVLVSVALFGSIGFHLFRSFYLNEELFFAAQQKDHHRMKQLLRWGADPNAPFDHATYPLEESVRGHDLTGSQILISFGAEPSNLPVDFQKQLKLLLKGSDDK